MYNYKRINTSNNKIKTVWKIINEQAKKPQLQLKSKKNISINIDGKQTDAPLTVANKFNEYFSSIGLNMNNNQARGRPVLSPTCNTLFLSPVTHMEIEKCIKKLKNKHSFGIDEIPPSLVKKCASELTIPLTFLINQSFSTGKFPDTLKIAIVKPVPKTGDLTDPGQYRPIALLPTISKIFEMVMATRLSAFCNKYEIFDDSQFGFRKKRCTILTVNKFMYDVINIIDSKKYALGLLLDMSKAYDRVQHNILLNKLYGIGIRGTAHDWFKSYLTNRIQYVEIDYFNKTTNSLCKIMSQKRYITCSIPQGSVLGCILFLIYINDLAKIINTEYTKSFLYADDISIVFSCLNSNDLTHKLNNIFDTVIQWLSDHNLQLNLKKTNLIQFRPHQRSPLNVNFTYLDNPIRPIKNCNLLGIIIDENINWKTHIDKISLKISRFAYALSNIKKTSDLKTALSAYHAFTQTWLQYGIVLWGNSTNSVDLFILQKRCIRILSNIKNQESCRPYFKKLNILTLPSLYILETCKFVRKHPDLYIKAKDRHTSNLNLRYQNKIALPASNLQMSNKSPYNMSVRIFNSLPKEIAIESKYDKFVNSLKTYLINNCFYSLQEYLDDNKYHK